MYFDGGCKGNNAKTEEEKKKRVVTIGAVIYKIINGERYLATQIKGVLGPGTNNDGEYYALLAGLKHLYMNNVKGEITIYGDSKMVIDQLNGRINANPKFLKYMKSYNFYKLNLNIVKLEHIPRAQNGEADKLGNDAYQEYLDKIK
jgi:ribonuclease HI